MIRPSGEGRIRGFDTPDLYRKDALIRIEYNERDIQERLKRLKEMEKSIGHTPNRREPNEGDG